MARRIRTCRAIHRLLPVPGAHVSHGAQTGDMNPLYWRPGQRSAVSIGGNRPNANYFLLDGTTDTDPTFNTLNLSPSPDAVQEFKVQTGSYSAEMGGAGRGQINIAITANANPNFNPAKPISPGNPQVIRDPFPNNKIPTSMLSTAAQTFLLNYLPAPNMPIGMNGCGMTMMGAPQVVGAGQDCNNNLASRHEHHVNDQGTVRLDHVFAPGDTPSPRYSLTAQNGFIPLNLPRFGTFHDDFSQNSNVS